MTVNNYPNKIFDDRLDKLIVKGTYTSIRGGKPGIGFPHNINKDMTCVGFEPNKIFNDNLGKSYNFINCKYKPGQLPCKENFQDCLSLELTNSPQVQVVYNSMEKLEKLEIS